MRGPRDSPLPPWIPTLNLRRLALVLRHLRVLTVRRHRQLSALSGETLIPASFALFLFFSRQAVITRLPRDLHDHPVCVFILCRAMLRLVQGPATLTPRV